MNIGMCVLLSCCVTQSVAWVVESDRYDKCVMRKTVSSLPNDFLTGLKS